MKLMFFIFISLKYKMGKNIIKRLENNLMLNKTRVAIAYLDNSIKSNSLFIRYCDETSNDNLTMTAPKPGKE